MLRVNMLPSSQRQWVDEMQVLGVDIGGSGIKGAPVDLMTGRLAAHRHRIATPHPATPDAVADVVAAVAAAHGWSGPFGVTIPGVVHNGVVATAANIDDGWIGLDAGRLFAARLDVAVVVINDADAAGLAEATFGAGRGRGGLVVLLTFGTGIGSALIHDGTLIPNSELGHLELHGASAEHFAASQHLAEEGAEDGLTLDEWVGRVNEYLAHVERILSPDLIIFGGGISKRFEVFGGDLRSAADIVPAVLRNNAGIVGAALAAKETR